MKYRRRLSPVLRRARFYLSKRWYYLFVESNRIPFVERKFVSYSSNPIIVNVRIKIMHLAKDTRETFHYQLLRAIEL